MRRLGSEDGVAMAAVMLATLALIILVVALLGFATNSISLSRYDQDWNASLAAAESGVDDYLSRLNQDGSYWDTFNAANPGGNQAFNDWAPIPGTANEGEFRYDVDTTKMGPGGNGTITLEATGQVRGETRTIKATIRKNNFLDYLYFTDLETKDPAAYVKPPDNHTPSEAQEKCTKYYYQGRDDMESQLDTEGCTRISFFNDVFNGPVHTNDAFRILADGSPQFNDSVTTSWPGPPDPGYLVTEGTEDDVSPTFARAQDPTYDAPKLLPPSNAGLKNDADPALGGDGCLFTGPTKITLKANGKMDVVSPSTTSPSIGCEPGTNVDLPPNGVVYVQNIPAGEPDNCPTPLSSVNIPLLADVTVYDCRAGDAFVEGVLDGRLTIGAENNVIVTNDLTYEEGVNTNSSDLLGLIANNYIEIYHPVDVAGTNLNVSGGEPFRDPTLHAAILAVKHSFRVQNFDVGLPLGTLEVHGVIAQKFRGPVATATLDPTYTVLSGYDKDYHYDPRLAYDAPPRFLDPAKSPAWQVVNWAELPPKY